MNPILSAMTSNSNALSLIRMLAGKDTDAVAKTLCGLNPGFKQFYEANRGKSVDQICAENGIDKSILSMFVK